MRGFWRMVDELRMIDYMRNKVETLSSRLCDHIAVVPIELKDDETVKAIVEKACKIEYDADRIIYTFNCECCRGQKYFLHLEKR